MNHPAAEAIPNAGMQTVVPVTAPAAAWQVVGAVVRGISHERLGMPCQDAQDYRVLPGGTLLVALADGAGTAAFSDQGARCAVSKALEVLAGVLVKGLPADDDGWQHLLQETFEAARAAVLRLAETNAAAEASLEEQAAPSYLAAYVEAAEPDELAAPEEEEPVQFQIPPERAYATTLTCAIAAADRLVVGQIGDGVVVAGEGDELFAITRLQRGEYANETHFLTQADALERLVIEVIEQPVSALAVMSDGLMRLALKMPEQEPHAPFFKPLFRVTATIGKPGGALDETEAARQLSAFLGSERVNARTDDDKSLVLAVRAAYMRAASLRESGEQTSPEAHTMEPDGSEGTAGAKRAGGSARNDAERIASRLDWERK